jgi:hypothetical protein
LRNRNGAFGLGKRCIAENYRTGLWGSDDVANFEQVSSSRETGIMKVASVQEARPRLDRTEEIADWVVANVPWTVAVPDWTDFHDRWPLLTRVELAAVEDELRHRAEALDAKDADLAAIAAALTGRLAYWTAAADWLTLNPGATITDAEFFRLFSQLSRGELILAAIEHKRRLLQQL